MNMCSLKNDIPPPPPSPNQWAPHIPVGDGWVAVGPLVYLGP
jgi:hypothetical protein